MSTSYNARYEDAFPWCAPDPKDAKAAVCKWCCKKIRIESMGRVALVSHEKSKTHKSQILVQNTNLKIQHLPSNTSQSNCPLVQRESLALNIPTASSSTEKQNPDVSSVMKKYMLNEQVTKAEILWALETIATHNSYRSAATNTNLFKKMFPDSQIAAKLEMGRTKVAYMITYGLAPYYTNEIFKELNTISELVIGFDETLNKISQRQQMDISVRYWNEKKATVDNRYLGSAFLNSSRAIDLLTGLKLCFERNPALLNNGIQLSMDGPNVNWKLLKDFSGEMRNLRGIPSFDLLSIGSCGLHAVHNAFKDGMKHTEWSLDEFLLSLYHLFKDFPLRRSEYTEITGSNLFPLKFCPVRWIENLSVAERASKMVPFLRVYVTAVTNQLEKKMKESHPSFKRSFGAVSQSRRFAVVEKAMSDQMLGPKLAFFISSAAAVEPFLREFQCDAPMAPFLFEELTALIHSTMTKVLKPQCINVKAKAITEIELIDSNTLPTLQVDVGFGVKAAIKSSMAREKISEKTVLQFRNDCKAYYVAFLRKMYDKSPLSHGFTRYISCISPDTIVHSPDIAQKRLESCLDYMVQRDQMAGSVADKVREEFSKVVNMPSVKSSLAAYRRNEQRLDSFWVKLLAETGKDFPSLLVFLKKILILSHGNATLERGFSVNKECLIVNLLEESLVAQRIVHDAILNAGQVSDVEIDKTLIQYARNAHGRYLENLEKKRNEKAQKDDEASKKRATAMVIKELESKKAKILAEAHKEAALLDDQMKSLIK